VRSTGAPAPLVVVSSDLTELAYNPYGGRSLYGDFGGATRVATARAYLATTARPISDQGFAQFLTMDATLAELLDRYDVQADWTTDTELDRQPQQLLRYRGVVLPGHSEYWTGVMYDALRIAVGAGVNLAVMGANEIYWQTRLTRDATGHVVSMAVYRSAATDPVTDPSLTTVRWRDAPLYRDPAALTGVGSAAVNVSGSSRAAATPAWLFGSPPPRIGSRLYGAIGNEGDGVEARSPANVQVLLSATVSPPGLRHPVHVDTTYYSAGSGAGVFAAGTTYWLCLALGNCPGQAEPGATRQWLARVSVNVLRAFGHPRWGAARPS
jgi:hypothetical protein